MPFLRAACLALGLSLFATSVQAGPGSGEGPGQGAPFTRIYAFGDSLTDTGNLFGLTGQPSAPYADGRFSNGPVWIEQLAAQLGVQADSLFNYAYGGATTGSGNENGAGLPGLQDEIGFFEADLGGEKADPRALYVIWAGANDFFVSTGPPEDTIATAIGNTLMAVQRLQDLGARRIMVVNLPDLGLTPLGLVSGDGPLLSLLTQFYNQSLKSALDFLDALTGIPTVRLDSAGIIQDMVANPALFGFSNVTDPYLWIGGNPSEFLFWDLVHPTTQAHAFVAQAAMQVLVEEFRHAWATPRPPFAGQGSAASQP